MKIDIVRRYDDFDHIKLGTVETETDRVTAIEMIDNLWDKFQETEPKCDTEFVDFVIGMYPMVFCKSTGDYAHYVG